MAALLVVGLAAPVGKQLPVSVTPTKVPQGLQANPLRPDVYTAWTPLNRVDAAGWRHSSRYQFWALNGLSARWRARRLEAKRRFHIRVDPARAAMLESFEHPHDALPASVLRNDRIAA